MAEDVKITGEGTYTVSLDFANTAACYANSTVFCALGISSGELLYPGYIIEVVDLQINGESYPLFAFFGQYMQFNEKLIWHQYRIKI